MPRRSRLGLVALAALAGALAGGCASPTGSTFLTVTVHGPNRPVKALLVTLSADALGSDTNRYEVAGEPLPGSFSAGLPMGFSGTLRVEVVALGLDGPIGAGEADVEIRAGVENKLELELRAPGLPDGGPLPDVAPAPDLDAGPPPDVGTGDLPGGDVGPDVDAGCGDLMRDPQNCGACGRSCFGGTCQAGVCQPLVISGSEPFPFALAIDDRYVYWTNAVLEEGSVRRASLLGEAPTDLATGEDGPTGLAVRDGIVYFVNYSGGAVRAVSREGGDVVTLGVGPNEATSLAASASALYWITNDSDGTLLTVQRDGGRPDPIFGGLSSPRAITADEEAIYWVQEGDGTIWRLPFEGGVDRLEDRQGEPKAIAVDGTHVYWVNSSSGTVRRIRKDGGSESNSDELASGQNGFGVALDATHVYWVNYNDGSVRRTGLAGGEVEEVARGPVGARSIAVDAERVYWTTDGPGPDGQVLLVRKP